MAIAGGLPEQPLRFRLRALPPLAAPGDAGNVRLMRPGAAIDLLTHRALVVKLKVEGPEPAKGELPPVLNLQLESSSRMYRDYYVDLDFRGEREIVLPESDDGRMLAEFRPAAANYKFKHAGYCFDYGRILALNVRWMRCDEKRQVRCTLLAVEALAEKPAVLKNPVISGDGWRFRIPAGLRPDDYAEFDGRGEIGIFDADGKRLAGVKPVNPVPSVGAAESQLSVTADEPATVRMSVWLMGKPLLVPRAPGKESPPAEDRSADGRK